MTFQSNTIALLLLPLFAHIVESHLTQEKLTTFLGTSPKSSVDQGTKWAILVAGSSGYGNYRHQADICHAYQILKKGGLKDENIVVFMFDDIANNEENPRKGIIINKPDGGDVYKGVPKDYTGVHVSVNNLLAVILGNKKAVTGGSGKVVNSGPNDHIFIYYADHGSPGVLTMPLGDTLYAKDLINTLKRKHASGTYKSMVIYVEACEAGSMFEGLLPNNWNIYATTASNPSENSYATYCPDRSPAPPPEYITCLGDLYSVAWMEDSDQEDLKTETLQQQYRVVKNRTASGKDVGSHVMQYGDIALGKDPLSMYMGISHNHGKKHGHSHHPISQPMPMTTFDQYEADLIYLKQKVRKAPEGSIKKAEAQKKLDETISHRKNVDTTVEAIGKTIFGGSTSYQMLNTIRSAGQPLVDDWDCLKTMVGIYKTYCGALNSYGMKYTRVFANMCNAGVNKDQMTEIASLACGNNFNIN